MSDQTILIPTKHLDGHLELCVFLLMLSYTIIVLEGQKMMHIQVNVHPVSLQLYSSEGVFHSMHPLKGRPTSSDINYSHEHLEDDRIVT